MLQEMMKQAVVLPPEEDDPFRIKSIVLDGDSFLVGKTLRGTSLRDYQCMIISVLHDGTFITNPEPDYHFEEGDTVWVAGNTDRLGWV